MGFRGTLWRLSTEIADISSMNKMYEDTVLAEVKMQRNILLYITVFMVFNISQMTQNRHPLCLFAPMCPKIADIKSAQQEFRKKSWLFRCKVLIKPAP